MHKDFDGWNKKKKKLEDVKQEFLFKQGEVWWCAIGVNVGYESCGKSEIFSRPVLVLKKLSSKNYIGIPLSTKRKIGTWFIDVSIQSEVVSALLYQIRMFSANRLERRITTLNIADFARVKEKLETLLELSS